MYVVYRSGKTNVYQIEVCETGKTKVQINGYRPVYVSSLEGNAINNWLYTHMECRSDLDLLSLYNYIIEYMRGHGYGFNAAEVISSDIIEKFEGMEKCI